MLSLLILVSRQKLVFQRDMAVSKMQWKLHIQVTKITKLEQIIFQHCVNCLLIGACRGCYVFTGGYIQITSLI